MLCDTNSREDKLFSPPTLPYTLESVVENMNRNGSGGYASNTLNLNSSPSSTSQDTNIFQSPSSSGSSSKASKSPGGRIGEFFCGSYGQGDASKSASVVPLEDVLRWKEFRRRQKEMQEIQLDAGDEEFVQSLPNLDSLSLSSASNASSFDVVRRKELKEPYDLQKSPQRKAAMEIDPLGFPAKDTNLMTELKEETAASTMSEAPTEIASNTLFSRLLASNDQPKSISSVLGETTSSSLPSSEKQYPTASLSTSGRKKVDLRVNTSSSTTPNASSAPLSTRSMSSNLSTRSDTSARERFGEMKRLSSAENAWDDTKPTLEIDALNESSVKEEPSLDCSSSENKNDVSMVSSNWDPLHVTTIEEGDEADDDSIGLDRTNIHGEIDDSFVDKESSNGAQESEGALDASPNSVSSGVRTLMEVKSFMSKLDSLRDEQRINIQSRPTSNQSQLPSSLHDSPPGVELKEVNAEDTYFQSLLEKKEKLRQHKLESQRKRNELDDRLKAMRNKLQSPSAVSRYGGESTNESMVALDDSSKGKTPETESKGQFLVSPNIGARWSGGRAMWSSPGSSPQISPEVDSKTKDRRVNKATTSEEPAGADPSITSPLHNVIKSMASIGASHLLSRSSSVDPTAEVASKMTTSYNSDPDATSSQEYLSTDKASDSTAVATKLKDDFSFKPTLVTKQIPFSPITAERKSTSKFSFSSPDINQSSTRTTPASKEPTLESSSESPLNASQPSTPIPTTSPDASEGDKGGGLGFGYIFGDKSVVSKSSSNFVELGQVDSSLKGDDAEEKSLVGVTVVGSKERKKRTNCSSSDEESSNQARLGESPKIVAPDPPGVESYDVWRENKSVKPLKKHANNLTIDCSNAVTNDARQCETEQEKSNVTTNEPPTKTTLSIQPPLSPVAESTSSDNEFDAIIQKANAISNTPRNCLNTPKSSLETPRATNTASLKSPRFRADRESKISALKSKFESQGLKTTYSDLNWANQFSMESTKMWSTIMKESNVPTPEMPTVTQRTLYELTKPSTGFFPHPRPTPTFEPHSTIVPTLSDVKEELTQTDSLDSSLSSFKGLNIQELRSRFENNESLSVESNKKHNSSEKRRSLVTEEMEPNKVIAPTKTTDVTSNSYFTADASHPELSKTKEAGSNETENSAKENVLHRTTDSVFPNFSPVAVRKKAFEMRKQQSRIRAATPKKDQITSVLACQSANVEKPEIHPVTSMAQTSTPRLSVKERVASFNSPNFHQGTLQVHNAKQLMPFQKMTPPPSSINMSSTADGLMFSPLETFGSPNHERKQQLKRQSAPLPQNQVTNPSMQKHYGFRNNQVRSVQTSFDSAGDEDDYDDGITLSPTCSEVSGLTLPTCLGSVAEDKPKVKYNTPDFKCMSPIARHRQKQGANGGTLFNHPYLKRMMSNVSTPRANGQHQEHPSNNPQARAPTHREQIISRVIEKPSTPRKSQKASPSKKPPTPQDKKPIKKSVSYQSTPTTSSSYLNETQSTQHKKPQHSLSNQSTLTTASSNVNDSNDDSLHLQGKGQSQRKGKVAERVAIVNERTSRQSINGSSNHTKKIASRGAKEAKARYVRRSNNDEQSSTATRDCVRIN